MLFCCFSEPHYFYAQCWLCVSRQDFLYYIPPFGTDRQIDRQTGGTLDETDDVLRAREAGEMRCRDGGNQHNRQQWRVWRRQFNVLLLCLFGAAAPRPGGSVLFVVYNQTGQVPTRFDDVPALDGFGPRVPEEVSEGVHTYVHMHTMCVDIVLLVCCQAGGLTELYLVSCLPCVTLFGILSSIMSYNICQPESLARLDDIHHHVTPEKPNLSHQLQLWGVQSLQPYPLH